MKADVVHLGMSLGGCRINRWCGSHLVCIKKVVDENELTLLGLPHMCQAIVNEDRVYLQSLTANEHDVRSYAIDIEDILAKVKLVETLNPCARGFPALKIKTKA
jgi:hypothetical protein